MRQLLSDKEYMIMSRSLNKIMLIGNVGNDPDVRTTSSGTPIANMSLATTRKWKDGSGEQKGKTEWHRLTVWGKLVDVVKRYVKKGDRLYIEGRIEYSESESDGQKKYWTNVNVFEMVMLGGQRVVAVAAGVFRATPAPHLGRRSQSRISEGLVGKRIVTARERRQVVEQVQAVREISELGVPDPPKFSAKISAHYMRR